MTEKIREMYEKAGLRPPPGMGIHTEKFHRCVIKVKKKGKIRSPYAVCMESIGPKKAIKKSHLKMRG